MYSAGPSFSTGNPGTSDISNWQAFRQGVVLHGLSPKASNFFMAFLPQFVREALSSELSQRILLHMLGICFALVVEGYLVLALVSSEQSTDLRDCATQHA